MALFASLFRKKKVNEVVSANNPIELLPPELKDEFKTSGIPISDLETREDWILLLNCFFFGSARHDYRPLPELLQEYDEFQKQHSTDSQASVEFGSIDSGVSPLVVRKRSGSLKKGMEGGDRRSPTLERIAETHLESGGAPEVTNTRAESERLSHRSNKYSTCTDKSAGSGESSKKPISKVPSTGNVSSSSGGHSTSQRSERSSSSKGRRVSRSSSSNDSAPSHSSEGVLMSGAGSVAGASRETSPHTTPPLLRAYNQSIMPPMSLGPSSSLTTYNQAGLASGPVEGGTTSVGSGGGAASFSGTAGPLHSSHNFRTGSLSPDLKPIRVRGRPTAHSLQGNAANLIESKLGGVGDPGKLPSSVYEPSASESESGVASDHPIDNMLIHNTDALLGLLQPIVITDPSTTSSRSKHKSGKGSISPERARKRGERGDSIGSHGSAGGASPNLSSISFSTPGATPTFTLGMVANGNSSAAGTPTSPISALGGSGVSASPQFSPHLLGSSAASDRSPPISAVHQHQCHSLSHGHQASTQSPSSTSASSPGGLAPLHSSGPRRAESPEPVSSPLHSGSWTSGGLGGDRPSRRHRSRGSPYESEEDEGPVMPRGRTMSPHFSPVHGHRSRSASPMSYQGEGRLLSNTGSRTPMPLLEDYFQMEDATHTYKMLEKLGKGSFGNVYIAKRRKDKSSKRYAIKKCATDTRRKVQTICREIGNLRNANHPNVVKFIGSYYHKETAWIVMEYCDAGTLRDLRYATTLEEQHIAYVMHEILKGLSYMHGAGMMHRDIKGENVLLSVQGDVKVADLGLAVPAVDDQKRIAGSKYWMAPEMILAAGYGPKADIYSLGCTAYELADGLPPYAQFNAIKALFSAAKHGFPPLDCPKAWSKDFLDFLALCSHPNPRDRPSSMDLLSHPFLNKACSKSDFAKLISSAFVMGSFHGFDI